MLWPPTPTEEEPPKTELPPPGDVDVVEFVPPDEREPPPETTLWPPLEVTELLLEPPAPPPSLLELQPKPIKAPASATLRSHL